MPVREELKETKKTIGQVLHETAERYPDRTAVLEPSSDTVLTYAEFDNITDRLAKALTAYGVRKDMHVGLCAADNYFSAALKYAVWKTGAVLVLFNTGWTDAELKQAVKLSDTVLLLSDSANVNELFSIRKDDITGGLPEVIDISGQQSREALLSKGDGIGDDTLEKIKSEVKPDDPDSIIFTSGTTAAPRPVITTHYSRVNSMFAQAEALETTHEDIFCSVLPSFHCFSLTGVILAAHSAGACLCFPENRHCKTILKTIEETRATILAAVPTLFDAIVRRYREYPCDISSLRAGMIGGSTYSPSFLLDVSDALGIKILPSLGQTEATAGITSASLEDSREVLLETIGRFFPGTEGCIKHPETGERMPYGAEGEICVRGYNVMQGYYNMPEETALAIDKEGFLHTGDLGKMNEDGLVWYTGRLKEMIIRGGENIAPSEVEHVISENEEVESVRVIGVPDAHYTEEVCACIVLKEGKKLTAEQVRDTASKKLASYKVPRYVLFFSSLPVSSTGKILLQPLREEAMQKLNLS